MVRTFTRRSFGALAGLGAYRLSVAEAATARVTTPERPFAFGAHIYREPHLPLEQLRDDMGLLKRLGFNMVKLQESWSVDEPREGHINLDTLAGLVSHARDLGLAVFFGVTMEQAPAWLWRKFPDAHQVFETGESHNDPTQYLVPGDGKPGPCWHHPGARAAASRFLQALARTMSRFDNVRVWNLWQEVGTYSWAQRPGHLGLCYCKHTLGAYRVWLKARFGGLAQLNAAWRTQFGAWDEVEPPRVFRTVPAMIDWRIFMESVVPAEALRWKGEPFRRLDPLRRPVMAHTNSARIGSTQDAAFAREVDVYGSSLYPDWSPSYWEAPFLNFDYVRSAANGRPVWAAEVQGGPISDGLRLRAEPDAEDIRRWVLGALATGVQGLCFWNHRPEILWSEAYGFGLLGMRGEETARSTEAGKLARAIAAQDSLFVQAALPAAEVGLVIGAALNQFVENSVPETRTHYQNTVRGNYRALIEAGHMVEFVDIDALLPPTIKVLIAPFPLVLSQAGITALASFVERGGTLIAEACAGRFDDHGVGRSGGMDPVLERLFGCRHARLRQVANPGAWSTLDARLKHEQIENQALKGAGAWSEHRVVPALYVQALAPTTAEAILHLGDEVVGTVNHAGKGHAYLVGTLMGHGTSVWPAPGNASFLNALLARAGVRGDRVGRLVRRRRVHGARAAWFFINFSDAAVTESVSWDGYTGARDLLGDAGPFPGRSAPVTVPAQSVRCWLVG